MLMLRKQVFWVVVSCGWVICYQSFEEICYLHLQRQESIYRLITLQMKVMGSFKMQGSCYLIKWCSNQEDFLPQYENRFASVFALSFPVSTLETSLHWPYLCCSISPTMSLHKQQEGLAVTSLQLCSNGHCGEHPLPWHCGQYLIWLCKRHI